MRNKDRIRPFCERLAAAWERCPDIRFGQFICNVYASEVKRDPFYIEDDESMRLIENTRMSVLRIAGRRRRNEYEPIF